MTGGAARLVNAVRNAAASAPGRELVLSRIRTVLVKAGETQLPNALPLVESAVSRTELVHQLAANAGELGVTVHIANTLVDARAVLQRWLNGFHVSRFSYVSGPTLARLGISEMISPFPEELSGMINSEDTAEILRGSEVGVNEATAAIADTGTVVEASGRGCSRLLSLIPPVHISVVSSERIVPDLLAWINSAGLPEAFKNSSAFTLITGPSRTADIELTLTKGVHGPGEMYMLVVDERE